MKNPVHRAVANPIISAFVLSAIVLVPSLVLLSRGREIGFAGVVLLQSVLTWAVVVCALSRRRLLLWVSLPVFMLIPVETTFIWLYGYPSSRHVIALLGETTVSEASEFMSGLWLMLAIGLIVVLTVWLWLYLRWTDLRLVSRRTQLAAVALLLAGTFGLEIARAVPGAPLWVRQYTWANAFPVGVPFRLAGYFRAQAKTADARAAIDRFEWGATAETKNLDLVFVIGESSRPDHWALAGYGRDTTPRLSAMGDVVFLPDLVTPWTLTRYSVPAMLTRKPATMADIFAEKSIIAAFREAGFKTYWFANQDGIEEVSLHSAEAEQVRMFNLAVGRGDIDADFDGVMLPAIHKALSSPAARRLLVIHTKGSHWDSDRRYPPEFAYFKPDRTGNGESGKYDRANRATLVNAYDNSIRYTDYFLAEIISSLRRSGRPSALVYVSDHGEGLYDGECTLFGHGNDLEASFRTAGLVWISPSLSKARPLAKEQLLENAADPLLTTHTVFNTLADLGTLSIADRRFSLIAAGRVPQKRLVNTINGVADFDASSRAGACRLVDGTADKLDSLHPGVLQKGG